MAGGLTLAVIPRHHGAWVDEPALNLNDARDIRSSLLGDGEAYARLVRRYQESIARYLWRFSRDAAVHEQLLQDVFVEAYFSLRTYADRAPFEHWLKRIATRTGYRFWKRRRHLEARRISSLEDGPAPLAKADQTADAQEAAQSVHAVLSRLPPRDRLVLTLMYFEEQSVEQIASLTGWTRTMVKVQAFRARGRLRKLLRQEECPS